MVAQSNCLRANFQPGNPSIVIDDVNVLLWFQANDAARDSQGFTFVIAFNFACIHDFN